MVTEEQFESLVEQVESETLDFKATGYDLGNEHGRLALVKDVLCMANTPRDSTSFIILGVKKHPDGTHDLWGLQTHPDEADLQAQFVDRVYPVPKFTYSPIRHGGRSFGAIVIPPLKTGPCLPIHDQGKVLRQWQVYFRRGSKNDVALGSDLAHIFAWFREGVPSRAAYKDGDQAWDSFVRSIHNFERSRHYILIVSPHTRDSHTDLSALGRIPWTAVLDFDPDSDTRGILSACKSTLEQHRSVHLVAGRERPTLNLRSATYWYFARGLAGREDTVERGPWRAWQKACGAALAEHLRRLSSACSPAPVTCVALWYDAELVRHLQSALEQVLGTFGEHVDIVVVSDDPADAQPLAADVGAALLEIPLHQLCSGLASLSDAEPGMSEGSFSLPSSSGAPVPLSSQDQHYMEEELDIVDLGVGLVAPPDRRVGREFLRGAEISWYDLGLHYDIERDLSEKLQRQLEADLVGRRTSRVNLYHAPGAGGTTVARRLLWNLHRRFPCAILHSTNPVDTAERLSRLTSLTGLSLLLLIDGAEVAERQIDELYDQLRARHVPATLLQVLRRFTFQSEGARASYLRTELSASEAARFAHVFSREEPGRKLDIDALLASPDRRFRSAFYFGLQAFRADFLGLESFVAARLAPLTPVQKKIVGFLGMAHHYAQQALPAQAFAELLGLPHSRRVDLVAALPEPMLDILVQGDVGVWRTAHDLIADEILQQLLCAPTSDRRQWTHNLSRWAIDFGELCRGSGPSPSEHMLEVARRTFVYRDNAELLGTERSATKQFAQLLQDIPSTEGRLIVLRKLCDLYPEEAHFWAHLGRFHSIERREHLQALECIDHAIALHDNDSVLHHMKGMAVREQVYDAIAQGESLPDIVELAKQSSKSFERARELSPDDEHGYISEVQMLVRLLDYAGRQHTDGLVGYLASHEADPYLRDCFERTEDLLERVRRNREGQGASPYEEDCRAKIDALYGRHNLALETWNNLLARKSVYEPPIRRQIVWTYLARRGRSWDALEPKEVDRITALLEDNLAQEPYSDANLRLWVQAVRRSTNPPSVEAVIERVGYWRAIAASLEASFYLYALYALQAIDGSALGRDSALRFLEECRNKARFLRNRTKSFEWLGRGSGVGRLVHHSQLGEWRADREFWANTRPLFRVSGRIKKIEAPQSGQIELPGGLDAFFVPARGNYSRGRSENRSVTLFLGFSYDGLRAWEVKDA